MLLRFDLVGLRYFSATGSTLMEIVVSTIELWSAGPASFLPSRWWHCQDGQYTKRKAQELCEEHCEGEEVAKKSALVRQCKKNSLFLLKDSGDRKGILFPILNDQGGDTSAIHAERDAH